LPLVSCGHPHPPLAIGVPQIRVLKAALSPAPGRASSAFDRGVSLAAFMLSESFALSPVCYSVWQTDY